MQDKKWYQLPVDKVLEETSSTINGLNKKEVIERQKKEGLNILPKKEGPNLFKIFFSGFKDPIVVVLLIASLLSILSGEVIDALAIVFIILLDLILGAVEEYKANKSAEALQNLIKVEVKVIRDGQEQIIDSEKLVIGDIIMLEAGNKISADARIIESKNLTVNEASLTGESINAIKDNLVLKKDLPITDRTNMIYAGTSVITGRAIAVVTSIGANTEIGKIATEVNNTKEEKSPLTIRMEKFSKQISTLIIIVSIIIAFILISKGFSGTEIFVSVIALSVSAMPEGLHLALTMALTIGSNRMLKKNVIVKRLNAVESLGSCTVIASDKTGTLTVNEQTARKILLPDDSAFNIEGSGYNDKGKIIPIDNAKLDLIHDLIKVTALNNEANLIKKGESWEGIGDSIDIAFVALGKKYGIDTSEVIKREIIPYESENKYSALFYEKNNEIYCTAKGSIETILEFCDSMIINGKKKKLDREKIIKQNEELAKEGFRVIGVAQAKITGKYNSEEVPKLSYMGMVAFIDPIRDTALESIVKCRDSGIKVVMITGDHPLTAFSIAKELGIAKYYNDVATGIDIETYLKKGEIEFDNFVRNKTVFSRVTPLQKLKIVESYKRQGEFVAVTGDGVNDAPALKAANIGIAMGSGTDVAKETASMIIRNDDFTSIVDGVEEGRIAYSNIRKICYLLLSCGISEVLFFLLALIFNMPVPLVAIQLLWINIVTDGLQDLALSFEKGEKDIMSEKPRRASESLFDLNLVLEVLVAGVFIGLLVFAVWYYLVNIISMDVTVARGYILMLMVLIQNIHVLNCRSEKHSTFKISLKQNPFVIYSILGAVGLQIIFIEVPVLSQFLQTTGLPITHILVLFILAVPVLIIMELYKIIRFYK